MPDEDENRCAHNWRWTRGCDGSNAPDPGRNQADRARTRNVSPLPYRRIDDRRSCAVAPATRLRGENVERQLSGETWRKSLRSRWRERLVHSRLRAHAGLEADPWNNLAGSSQSLRWHDARRSREAGRQCDSRQSGEAAAWRGRQYAWRDDAPARWQP